MGDAASRSYEEFFATYLPDVRRYASRSFGVDDADDIAQETMLRAYAHFDELRDAPSAWPWLVIVARNVGIDRLRRRRALPLGNEVVEELTPPAADGTSGVAHKVDVVRLVRRAMRRLSPLDRQMLVLHEVDGVAINDIAASAGVSSNTVRQRLFRARNNLARLCREGGAYGPGAPTVRARVSAPVRRVAASAHRYIGYARPNGAAATAAGLVAAAAVLVPGPSARVVPPPRPVPVVADVPGVVANPLLGSTPHAFAAAQRGVRRVAAAAAFVPRTVEESWERAGSLDQWSVDGGEAVRECGDDAYDGRCWLRLTPADTTSVTRRVGVPVVLPTLVDLAVDLPEDAGAQFQVTVRLDTDTAVVTFRAGSERRATVTSSTAAAPADVILPDGAWQVVRMRVDPAARTFGLSLDGYRGNAPLATVPLRRTVASIASVTLSGTRTSGATSARIDGIAVRSSPACSDGVDNDGDGEIDALDPGCHGPLDPDESPNPECSDGIDNDGDGHVDTDDPACPYGWYQSESPPCSDGIDNDGDGAADYPADAQCDGPADTTEVPLCRDGVDDDADGFTDYPADLGCRSPDDDTEWACALVDQPRTEVTVGACLDPQHVVASVGVAAVGPPEDIVGYVQSYDFDLTVGPVTVACVVLGNDDPCGLAGGTPRGPTTPLFTANAEPVPDSAATTAAVCTARFAVVAVAAFMDDYVDVPGDPLLTLC